MANAGTKQWLGNQEAFSGDYFFAAFSSKDHGQDAGALSPTLRSMSHDQSHANGGGQVAVAWNWQSGGDVRYSFGKPTLQACQTPAVGVRRLTPTECARLQGFPDDWNAWLSDTVRYRQFGNAVAVPVAEWIGKRIMAMENA